MTQRTSIKPSRSTFDRLNDDRKRREMKWDEYLNHLYESSEQVSENISVTIDSDEVLREMLSQMPDATGILEVRVDTEALAKDIAAYAGGAELDESELAQQVSDNVQADVDDALREIVGS